MNRFRPLQKFVPRRLWRTEQFQRKVLEGCDFTVQSGPFSGMKYLNTSIGSTFLPKVLGTYEKELHSFVERLVAGRPRTVLNIGAAEGYYGAGFALRVPEAEILFWEAAGQGRALIEQLLEINSIPRRRTKMGSLCTISDLRQQLTFSNDANPVLIVDVEGSEAILLDPLVIPALAGCSMLVEIHEFAIEGVEAKLRERFSDSHVIERVACRARTLDDWPRHLGRLLRPRFKGAAIALMAERRPAGMCWLVLWPKSPGRDCRSSG